MSQTEVPNEFAKYMQNQISVGLAPDMNEMIFAYIPDLDPSQPIDPTQGLPNLATWVHQQDIDQLGKLGDGALVYSAIIKSDAEFIFNAIYLRDKNVPNSCGMVVHKAKENKELGSEVTRSLMMEYVNAAQIVGVTQDAATWQIDYQARLKGMDEDLRLACLDNYGHTAFVDGFDVTQQADPNKYKITPGVVYVGGLRAVLSGEVLQTITTKPNGIYIDVVRDGTALSAWENTLTIKVSTTPLNDHVDEAGRKHYVAKLAGINADGSVVDWRVKGGLEALKQPWSAFVNYSIGEEVVRNGLRYIACAASGPDNGGAVMPGGTQQVWDRVLPQSYSIRNPAVWVKIAVVNGGTATDGDAVSISVFGGSNYASTRRFSAEISLGQRGSSFEAVITPKILGVNDPRFYIKQISPLIYELWFNRSTSFPGVLTVVQNSVPLISQTLVGILDTSSTEPEGVTLVPYDTGYQYASIPIGSPFPHIGNLPPTNDPRFRYVVLTDADPYNDGVLINKEVSGVAPNLVIKYTIDMPESPLRGTKIEMLNTMESVVSPSITSGKVFNDTIRDIEGTFGVRRATVTGANIALSADGAFGLTSKAEATYNPISLDSSLSLTTDQSIVFAASNTVPTGARNQTFAIGYKYLMRVK
ncbi:phage tail protein [Vibrio sp. B1-2]|uniref:phage tail-collar fiber domain-containing protein n=1 Tax=Vibrio sp. B1-2 TaxID=2591465 RepID=UPI00148316E2|nr:phage tail protein [Vibrio sp. B1-2]NNN99098.1 phage tail protein [Vibrio sp. B1-2]